MRKRIIIIAIFAFTGCQNSNESQAPGDVSVGDNGGIESQLLRLSPQAKWQEVVLVLEKHKWATGSTNRLKRVMQGLDQKLSLLCLESCTVKKK